MSEPINPYIQNKNLNLKKSLNHFVQKLDLSITAKNLPELIYFKIYEKNTLTNNNWILLAASETLDRDLNPLYLWEPKIDYIFSICQTFRIEINEIINFNNNNASYPSISSPKNNYYYKTKDDNLELINESNNNFKLSLSSSSSSSLSIISDSRNEINSYSTKQLNQEKIDKINMIKKVISSSSGISNIKSIYSKTYNSLSSDMQIRTKKIIRDKYIEYNSKLIGYIEFNLINLIQTNNQQLEISIKKQETSNSSNKIESFIILNLDHKTDSQDEILLQFSTTFTKMYSAPPKTYLTIWKPDNEVYSNITKTEYIQSLKPIWSIKIKLVSLCNNNYNFPIKILIHKIKSNGTEKIVGSANFTLNHIFLHNQLEFDIIRSYIENDKQNQHNKNKLFGKMNLISFKFINNPTFINYLFKGATLKYSLFIDFSENNKPIICNDSFHHINNNGSVAANTTDNATIPEPHLNSKYNQSMTKYEKVYSVLTQILKKYSRGQKSELFGFAGIVDGKILDCFKIAESINHSFIEDYRNTLKIVQLGPSICLGPVLVNIVANIKNAIEKDTNKLVYYVAFVFISSFPSDLIDVNKILIDICTEYPATIIFIGIGEGPWDIMYECCAFIKEICNQKGKIANEHANIIEFVEYSNYSTPEMLSYQILSYIPRRMTDFFLWKGIYPGSKWILNNGKYN